MSEPVLQVLEYFKLPVDVVRHEIKLLCPFHEESNPSLGMNPETGVWWCFGCQRGGSLQDFVAGMNGGNQMKALILIHELRGRQPTGELPAIQRKVREIVLGDVDVTERWRYFHKVNWERISLRHPVAYYMIEKRDFRRHVLNAFDVRLTEWDEYPVVFPIQMKGRMLGWVKRALDDRADKYLYNTGFPGEWAMAYERTDDSPCLVVEGILDFMKAAQFGVKHAAGILSWKIKPPQVKYLQAQGVEEVVCGLDNSPQGRKGCQELREHFRRVYPLKYPGTWRKDVADLTVNEFTKAMMESVGR